MGLFRTQDSTISQAMPLTAAMIASIDSRPAWLFENQSGTLGTNLNSSVIYCGVMPADASISVILPGSSQVITFEGLQSGSILPVAVDYVTAVAGTGVTVGDFIVGR